MEMVQQGSQEIVQQQRSNGINASGKISYFLKFAILKIYNCIVSDFSLIFLVKYLFLLHQSPRTPSEVASSGAMTSCPDAPTSAPYNHVGSPLLSDDDQMVIIIPTYLLPRQALLNLTVNDRQAPLNDESLLT